MGAGTEYAQEYGQAEKAYLQGNYEQAASIIDQVVEQFPDQPSALLLKGHIYCYGLQQYEEARKHYERVLEMTDEPDFVTYANNGLEHASQLEDQVEVSFDTAWADSEDLLAENSDSLEPTYELQSREAEDTQWVSNNLEEELDLGSLEPESQAEADSTIEQELIEDNPFMTLDEDADLETSFDPSNSNPFGLSDEELDWSDNADEASPFAEFEPDHFPGEGEETPFSVEDDLEAEVASLGQETEELGELATFDETEFLETSDPSDLGSESATFMVSPNQNMEPEAQDLDAQGAEESLPTLESESILTEPNFEAEPELPASTWEENQETAEMSATALENEVEWLSEAEPELTLEDDHEWLIEDNDPSLSFQDETLLMVSDNLPMDEARETELVDENESEVSADFFLDQQVEAEFEAQTHNGASSSSNFELDQLDQVEDVPAFEKEVSLDDGETEEVPEEFFEEFDVFNEEIGNFDFEDVHEELPNSGFGLDPNLGENAFPETEEGLVAGNQGALTLSKTAAESLPTGFAPSTEQGIETQVEVKQGLLRSYLNAPLQKKNWLSAASAGIVSAITVAVVSFATSTILEENKAEVVGYLRITGVLTALAAGATSFGTTLFLGRVTRKQIECSTKDLQAQFEAMTQGNFNAKATVYAEDEFGQLASGFNQMARVILTTTSEAQRKAEEQEQAKEDLQRQVIRLLDDVEGAARGDLTVQAEVTADVLGAVADAFNLTIQNLREIVLQVKQAARQVSRGSTENESFARGLSSDALRQAEELAVTLNSVQMMTDSIQRVAENAREAEEVARSASATALKGGEAVEHTVAGILQIRETVAETARKVKRLAESSQEISKIVAVVSSIASRTNLLALNASIEAARAGEAGRGFAIVADEVRQLADRSAKALKEIEQIVLQIQSETNLVMTAMEEGTQQVIDGTKRAEQAKGSLEDIIQVSNRIDALVRSITADTVEQTETSRAVAQVMQSVELTAQETSQEAQRVSGSLQSLVTIARDLLISVERFRVEAAEEEAS